MSELGEFVTQQALTVGIALLVVVLLIVTAVVLLRRSARGPRARGAADAERARAERALVQLDDDVAELDLEVGLSGALYDGTAPPALRRARVTAERVRDDAFALLRDLPDDALPADITRAAARILTRVSQAEGQVAAARTEHAAWSQAHRSAAQQVAAARDRWRAVQAGAGSESALVDDLAERFDAVEVSSARRLAEVVEVSLREAHALLGVAETHSADPTRDALTPLADAERHLRRASDASAAFEDRYRSLIDADLAVDDEMRAARDAVREAETIRGRLEPDAADRLAGEVRHAGDDLDTIAPLAHRQPLVAVARISRMRDRLDMALGDARSSQQRLRGARTALSGALATARDAIAHADDKVRTAGADARIRLTSAQHDLSRARSETDPVAALDLARRAARTAEDASALADYDRLSRGTR